MFERPTQVFKSRWLRGHLFGLALGTQLVALSGCEQRSVQEAPGIAKSVEPSRKAYENPAELALGTLPDGVGLKPGSVIPDLTVQDIDQKAVNLRQLARSGPLLLVFYRGGWCPYCNFQIHELVEAYPSFKAKGIRPVAISVDRPEEGAKTRATYAIPFPVLSDPELSVHKAFNVVNKVSPEYLAKLKSMGKDLESYSGRPHNSIAIPAVFLIDRSATVRWAHAHEDYKLRPSAAQLLSHMPPLD